MSTVRIRSNNSINQDGDARICLVELSTLMPPPWTTTSEFWTSRITDVSHLAGVPHSKPSAFVNSARSMQPLSVSTGISMPLSLSQQFLWVGASRERITGSAYPQVGMTQTCCSPGEVVTLACNSRGMLQLETSWARTSVDYPTDLTRQPNPFDNLKTSPG